MRLAVRIAAIATFELQMAARSECVGWSRHAVASLAFVVLLAAVRGTREVSALGSNL